ncbi:MAG: DUF2062 domain-containing protein [Acidobacteria bacterium]|nr:DUF2062 domain-containing protein [Acidobacteriota bacterium]
MVKKETSAVDTTISKSVERASWRRWLDYWRALMTLDDTPEHISLSFAIGVFIAFSPFLGLHTLLCIALSFLFRGNLTAMLAGSFINNPFTMFLIYGGELWVGSRIHPLTEASFSLPKSINLLSLAEFYHHITPYLTALLTGYFLLGGIAFGCSFLALRAILARRRRKEETPDEG